MTETGGEATVGFWNRGLAKLPFAGSVDSGNYAPQSQSFSVISYGTESGRTLGTLESAPRHVQTWDCPTIHRCGDDGRYLSDADLLDGRPRWSDNPGGGGALSLDGINRGRAASFPLAS